METITTLMTLCVVYCSILSSRHLVQSQKTVDKLQKMFFAINPYFNQGLEHLDKLFNLAMEDEEFTNYTIQALHSSIQKQTKSALDSFTYVKTISTKHLSQYQEDLNSLSDDISNKEKQLKTSRVQLERLTNERATWRKNAEDLQIRIDKIGTDMRRAEEEIERTKGEMKRRERKRWGLIFTTVVTIGYGLPDLLKNEDKIEQLKNQRDGYQASVKEYHDLLGVAKNNIREINARHKCTEDFIFMEDCRVPESQATLNEMLAHYPALTDVGAQIKNIDTFLTELSGNVQVINSKNQILVVFGPLLRYIDNLVQLLDNNFSFVIVLGDKEVVNRLRGYI